MTLPAIDHAHLKLMKSVETGRVFAHHRKKKQDFAKEMSRLKLQQADQPSVRPPKPLTPEQKIQKKLAPLGRPQPPLESQPRIRGLDVDPGRAPHLRPLSVAASREAKAKIIMTSPPTKRAVKPLGLVKVRMITHWR